MACGSLLTRADMQCRLQEANPGVVISPSTIPSSSSSTARPDGDVYLERPATVRFLCHVHNFCCAHICFLSAAALMDALALDHSRFPLDTTSDSRRE